MALCAYLLLTTLDKDIIYEPKSGKTVGKHVKEVKGDVLYRQVWVISRYKPFWKSSPFDIRSGRVHLDVWRIDEQRVLQSTGQAGRLIYPAHL